MVSIVERSDAEVLYDPAGEEIIVVNTCCVDISFSLYRFLKALPRDVVDATLARIRGETAA